VECALLRQVARNSFRRSSGEQIDRSEEEEKSDSKEHSQMNLHQARDHRHVAFFSLEPVLSAHQHHQW